MDSATPPSPARHRLLYRFLALAAVIFLNLLPASPVQAEPSPTEIEAMIDKQWEQLEPTIEQYNKIRSQLRANEKKAAALQKKIEPLALQAQLALAEVGDIASHFYKSGPTSDLNALLTTGSATTLGDQLSYLDRLARRQQAQIAGVVAARDKLAGEKAKFDALIAQQKKQQAELAARKKQIDTEVKRLQAMLPYTVVKVTNCPTIKGEFSSKAAIAVKTACAQVGDPYVWGADGPGSFDCSGLTQYAWKAAGIYLPHFTGDQWEKGHLVSRSRALPGDLVFFFNDLHHVGLYIGNGLMVHASRPGKPVNVAKIDYIQPIMGFRRIA